MTTFKDLRTGSTVYFLSRKDSDIEIKQGVVKQGPGMSHAPTPQPGQTINYMAPSVVDIEIELDGQSKQYEMQDSAEFTYGGGMLIATDIDRILTEIDSFASQAQERLNRREKDEACVERCKQLRLQYDPKAKERKEIDERFRGIEEGQRKFQTEMSQQMQQLSKTFEDSMKQVINKLNS